MSTIHNIVEHLKELITLHEQLVRYGKDKTGILVSGPIEHLSPIVQHEGRLMKQMNQAEAALRSEVAKSLETSGVALDRPTISDLIISLFRADEKKVVREARDRLLALTQQLKEITALNQDLVKQSLAFVEHSLDILTDQPVSEFTYSKPNLNVHSPRRGLFDKKA
jgi:flagellar biosynthesis/type III secretory pathway chaperone